MHNLAINTHKSLSVQDNPSQDNPSKDTAIHVPLHALHAARKQDIEEGIKGCYAANGKEASAISIAGDILSMGCVTLKEHKKSCLSQSDLKDRRTGARIAGPWQIAT